MTARLPTCSYVRYASGVARGPKKPKKAPYHFNEQAYAALEEFAPAATESSPNLKTLAYVLVAALGGVAAGVFLAPFLQQKPGRKGAHAPKQQRTGAEGSGPGLVEGGDAVLGTVAPSVTFRRLSDSFMAEYDPLTRCPRYVLEHLNAATVAAGSGVSREAFSFAAEEALPTHTRASNRAYAGSGYDRGHMAPAADHRNSATAMRDTFYLSNICPQVGVGFNRDYWARAEAYVRSLTAQYDDVWVLTGPVYAPVPTPAAPQKKAGAPSMPPTPWVHQHGAIGGPLDWISVPTHFYKVILARGRKPTNGGGASPAAANDSTAALVLGAFLLPNAPIEQHRPLSSFAVPVVAIEALTGLTVFRDKLSEDDVLEFDAGVAAGRAPAHVQADNLARLLRTPEDVMYGTLQEILGTAGAATTAVPTPAKPANGKSPRGTASDGKPEPVTLETALTRALDTSPEATPPASKRRAAAARPVKRTAMHLCEATPCELPPPNWFAKEDGAPHEAAPPASPKKA